MRKAKSAFEGQMQLSGTKKEQEAVGVGRWFRHRDLGIGTRLAACFVTIIVLMIASDAVAVWQFRRMEGSTYRLRQADQTLQAMVRVHVDIGTFRDRVAVMANTEESGEFAKRTASLRQKFLDDCERARRMLGASPELDENGTSSSALQTLMTALPAQLDTVSLRADPTKMREPTSRAAVKRFTTTAESDWTANLRNRQRKFLHLIFVIIFGNRCRMLLIQPWIIAGWSQLPTDY